MRAAKQHVILDWDGTVTERDTLDLVLGEFGDAEIYERVEAELDAGTMTLNEVIAAEFATVTTPLEDVEPWLLEHTRVRDGFAELARAHRPLVLSSGSCSVCGEPCKRADLPRDGEIVYAGDGYSDFCAVSAADRVFATGSLARRLVEDGVPFTPLTDFRALASEL